VPEQLVIDLVANIDTTEVEEQMKPFSTTCAS
jgi:hypothetical protein